MIAATIAIGDKHQAMAELAAAGCRKRTGLDTIILGESHLRKHGLDSPVQLKLKLFEECSEHAAILYFDADMVFLKDWNPTEFAQGPALVAVGDCHSTDWIRADARRIGIPPRRYFNGGLMIFKRDYHREVVDLAHSLYFLAAKTFKEQTTLNWACRLLDCPVDLLPREYNDIQFFTKPDFSETVVGHFISHNIASSSLSEIASTYRKLQGL